MLVDLLLAVACGIIAWVNYAVLDAPKSAMLSMWFGGWCAALALVRFEDKGAQKP